MKTLHDKYLLDLNATSRPRDLALGLTAGLFRETHMETGALRTLGDARVVLSPELLQALQERRDRAQFLCQNASGALDHTYLLASRIQQERAARAAQQAALVDAFRSSLTFVGSDVAPSAWSHFGWLQDNPQWPLALSRDSGHVILVTGAIGSGKTVFSTILGEGTLIPGAPLTSEQILPAAYVFFHIEEHDRLPQLLDGLKPNPTPRDLELLMSRLGVGPQGFYRLRFVAPKRLLKEIRHRLRPYEDLGLEVLPLEVHLSELGQPGLEAALGADEGARFVQRILDNAQDQGSGLCLDEMHKFIDGADDLILSQKNRAHARLVWLKDIASPVDGDGVWAMFEPGVATVVFLGGPHMGHARVAPALVGLMNALMMPSPVHGPFQRVIAVDEVNLLERDEQAWRAFIRTGRLVRHRGSTLILMGQDLLCVPDELFGLAGLCAVFQLRNPRVWEHIRERVGSLKGWRWEDVARLVPGEALLGAAVTTDPGWQQGGRLFKVRPPRCMHGGMTRAMV